MGCSGFKALGKDLPVNMPDGAMSHPHPFRCRLKKTALRSSRLSGRMGGKFRVVQSSEGLGKFGCCGIFFVFGVTRFRPARAMGLEKWVLVSFYAHIGCKPVSQVTSLTSETWF